MSRQNSVSLFQKSSWGGGYTIFDIQWCDIVLKNISKEDVTFLLKKFNIFFKEDINKLSQEEIIIPLLVDVDSSQLLPEIKKILEEKYNLISYDNAKDICVKLSKLDLESLRKIYVNISTNESLKEYYSDTNYRYRMEDTIESLIYNILEELYKRKKMESLDLINKYI